VLLLPLLLLQRWQRSRLWLPRPTRRAPVNPVRALLAAGRPRHRPPRQRQKQVILQLG
jgi:hypothetical protein